MTQVAFLDTGVIIGYCFIGDPHHKKCNKYFDDHSNVEFYASQHVESEYQNKKEQLSKRSATDVLDHRKWVKDNVQIEHLDPMDIQQIQNQLINWSADTSAYLSNYYENVVPNFITKDDLLTKLRKLARDFEADAQNRKQQIDTEISIWRQRGNYSDVEDSLSEIHRSDRQICIEAHDLGCQREHSVELATTNPTDLIDNGRETLILSSTQINSIADVSNRN